ncbi:aminoglycoside phosphotransferase [Beutenbergia cavernae DSM 12333]|uniref:Aminoglycoside phosphotransferase n=1 Tax=Beutenbergia cavernae (strain ATCC BAA-8 / DSM 12333 / CCUG 43141 / JCM 11478 / NBRC 16432 / NCIMB 13614 / HKI 0122) TaxID=471853 RepID=C5BZ53_BEUC1|nr:phosphotransferase [Beutenbergia cavernae]ACQ81168.1 aminoglycoside phosphotransferase [Beutenbergia cavernae DSM 12333]
MTAADATDLEALAARLGPDVDLDRTSIYAYAPVHRALLAGDDGELHVVVKKGLADGAGQRAIAAWQRALAARGAPAVVPVEAFDVPLAVGDEHWVVYPFVEGRDWDATPADIAAAGRLLGLQHAVSLSVTDDDDVAHLPSFSWPEHDAESVAEDVAGIAATCADQGIGPDVAARWRAELTAFHATTLPAIAGAGLPSFPVTLDYRATNLRYGADGPVFVDFENGEVAPRLLDLALAVLLFGHEAPANPGRLFDDAEWASFAAAYLAAAPPLTTAERALWETAQTYMRLEWGTWVLTEGTDADEWADERRRGLLLDLLTLEPGRFPLP